MAQLLLSDICAALMVPPRHPHVVPQQSAAAAGNFSLPAALFYPSRSATIAARLFTTV
jgi:hypothetical protein